VAILDWHSRYVLSWSLSTTQEKEFCLEALRGALGRSRPEIFNTDQGAQFTSPEFTGIRSGSAWTAAAGCTTTSSSSVSGARSSTMRFIFTYRSVAEARAHLGEYFRVYNDERPHEALGYRTPREVYYGSSGRWLRPRRPWFSMDRAKIVVPGSNGEDIFPRPVGKMAIGDKKG
jgi:putative transposase